MFRIQISGFRAWGVDWVAVPDFKTELPYDAAAGLPQVRVPSESDRSIGRLR